MRKTAIKLGDEKIYFKKSSGVVKYGNKTLEDALNKLPRPTDFGKKLAKAQNLDELKRLLQVDSFIFDEAENTQWTCTGYTPVSETNSKFGASLRCLSGNFIKSDSTVTFGGDPFTISFWAYIGSDSAKNSVVFSAGNDISLTKTNSGGGKFPTPSASQNILFNEDTLQYFEFGFYNGKVYKAAVNGWVSSETWNIPRAARTIQLGGSANVYFSEFQLIDGVCLHTTNFTPPTEPYSLTDLTKILLHFS